MTRPLPPEFLIGQALMLALKDFHVRLEQVMKQRGVAGIGQRHRQIFLYLSQHGASRSVDLAQAAGMRPQSMMVIIHELEAMDLIQRRSDPDDSRAKLIDFTAKGEALIAQLAPCTAAVWQQYEDILGKKRMNELYQALHTLTEDSR